MRVIYIQLCAHAHAHISAHVRVAVHTRGYTARINYTYTHMARHGTTRPSGWRRAWEKHH